MPKALILGSGTSNGIPTMGVTYPPGYLDNPRNWRCRPCLVLQGPTGNLLVDCPPELRLLCTRAGILQIDATLITHTHADHIMGMDDLRGICLQTGKAMPVYARPEHQEDIQRVFSYAFKDFPPGIFVPRFDLQAVPEVINVGGLRIETFVVNHGPVKVVGLRVNNFAYITDVSEIPPEARAKLNGLDVFVVDAVRYQPHPNHFHFERALEVAQEIGAQQTYLTHLSADYDHDKVDADLPPGVNLAYDGLEIEI